jgi:hypothetical protein
MMVEQRPLVCDTTLLLYLGRIGQVKLLFELYQPVYVPEEVAWELQIGRSLRSDTIDPQQYDWMIPAKVEPEMLARLPTNRLGSGERAVIAYAYANQGSVAGLDDRLARLFAESLNLKVVGLVGILIKAKRCGNIPSLAPLLADLQSQGFRMNQSLYEETLHLVGE